MYVTHSAELTRVRDTNGDGRADRFETVSDAWGYRNYHEYAFGSKFDAQGNLYVALGLSASYHSRALFRGWAMKITPDGKSIPIASGLRSPGGIGPNEHGALFYIESQGPWNSSCSLKFLKRGGFEGIQLASTGTRTRPVSKRPVAPESGTRIVSEKEKVKELVPYAVVFPYIRMGRSITGYVVDKMGGKFGPFENQIFLGDYTQSIIMRATTEQINGVWQGACYPFREGLSTGILNVQFTPKGRLLAGGTNRGWPVRGIKPFALERLDWTGKLPFEIKRIHIRLTDSKSCLQSRSMPKRQRSQELQGHHLHAHLSPRLLAGGSRPNHPHRAARQLAARRPQRAHHAQRTQARPRLRVRS